MSCPDWRGLAAGRHADDTGDIGNTGDTAPGGWATAVEHFDTCTLCRRQALMADPLLVFRRLPAVELTPADERSEVEAVRQAVATLRAAERLDVRRRFAGWRRWSAAAVLAVVALSVSRDKTASLPPAVVMSPAAMPATSAPALEGVNRPGARVLHMASEGTWVLMVFDESLDV